MSKAGNGMPAEQPHRAGWTPIAVLPIFPPTLLPTLFVQDCRRPRMASGVSGAPDVFRRAQDLILPIAIIASVLDSTGAAKSWCLPIKTF